MESSCDGFNPDITVGVEVGGEFDVEDDGGIVYIAEDILYSGGESESQADSYQVGFHLVSKHIRAIFFKCQIFQIFEMPDFPIYSAIF